MLGTLTLLEQTSAATTQAETCEPVPDALILDLPDARGFYIDIANGSQLMREISLLRAEANSMRVFWAQGLCLTVHLPATSNLARSSDCHALQWC